MNTALPPETHLAIESLALDLNDQLRSAATGRAEQTFGLSCSVLVVPLGLVLLVMFILGVRSPIAIGIAALVCLLLGVVFSTLAAQRARQTSMTTIYQEQIEPQIGPFLNMHAITRFQFDQAARQVLPSEAHLMAFMNPTDEIHNDPLKE